MHTTHPTPSKEAIALLDPFERLGLDRIELVQTLSQAERALDELARATAWGFDTESKPTFQKHEVSHGPHVVQLATLERAWVFQLHDADCRALAAEALARPGVVKAGFGLGDDGAGDADVDATCLGAGVLIDGESGASTAGAAAVVAARAAAVPAVASASRYPIS